MSTEIKGQTLDQQKREILEKYNLDFNITKTELQANIVTNDGGLLVVPSGYYGLYNDKSKSIINTVKEGYRVSQTAEVVEMVLKGMKGFGNLSITKGGSIHDGRKVYLQLEIKGLARVGGDDLIQYITIIDSNDGSTGLSVGIGNLTMSCSNQFFKFYKAGDMRAKHTGSLGAKILEMPHLISLALSNNMLLLDQFETFQKTKASKKLVDGLMEHLLGYELEAEITPRAKKNMDTLKIHMTKEIADKGMNFWGALSGVTSWTTHDKQAPKRANGRNESLIVGTNYKTSIKAYEYLLDKVK